MNNNNNKTIIINENIEINESNETRERRRNITMEYIKMEEKQSKLCNILATNVYKKFDEINKNEKLCEQDDLNEIFHSIIELEGIAKIIHSEVAQKIQERLHEWNDKPYFGDILKKYFKFYNIYKQILLRYPKSKEMLAEQMKKQKFSNSLQKLLVSHYLFSVFLK